MFLAALVITLLAPLFAILAWVFGMNGDVSE